MCGESMRDMSQVLERWAGWAKTESSGIDYSSIAAGFKGLLPQTSKMGPICSDDDGLIIERCLAKLRTKRPAEYNLIVLYYLYGISKRKLALRFRCDEKMIRIKMQMAEGFIDGCLSWLEVKLDYE